MFATGLNKIFEKISQISDKQQQVQAFNHLENQLLKNPYIKHQFEVMNKIKRNRGVITTQENFNAFVKALNDKRAKFMKEHKKHSHLSFWKATKELLEYFNINPRDIVVDELDTAIDTYSTSKKLNENIIKNLVFKPLAKEKIAEKGKFAENTVVENVDNPASNVDNSKKVLKEVKNRVKNTFLKLKNTKNELDLDSQFSIIHFLSEGMKGTHQKMIQTSLTALKEEKIKDVNSTVNKLYKLRVITEKLIYEKNKSDKPRAKGQNEEANGMTYFAKPAELKQFQYINKVEIVSPFDYTRPEKILIFMSFPVYPLGITRNSAITSNGRVETKCKGMKAAFLNNTVFKAGRTKYFSPNGTIWTADVSRIQVTPGDSVKMELGCYLATNPEGDGINTFQDFVKQSLQMVKEFDAMLPHLLGDLQGNLSQQEQHDMLRAAKKMTKSQKTAKAKADGAIDNNLVTKLLSTDNTVNWSDEDDWMDGMLVGRKFPQKDTRGNLVVPDPKEREADLR
jgi:hypothetical protein